jgi:hypothetical protein
MRVELEELASTARKKPSTNQRLASEVPALGKAGCETRDNELWMREVGPSLPFQRIELAQFGK